MTTMFMNQKPTAEMANSRTMSMFMIEKPATGMANSMTMVKKPKVGVFRTHAPDTTSWFNQPVRG